jgi:hypothetical protein
MAGGGARDRARAAEASKVRKQKLFIGIGGGLLLAVVGFQVLPALLGGSSSSGSSAGRAAVAASAAVPIVSARSAGSGAAGSASLVPKSVARLKVRDVFVPQITTSSGASPSGLGGTLLQGPPVRLKHFVAKDVFIPQIKPPAAAPASTAVASSGDASAPASAGQEAGSGYIVILDSIPGIGASSEKAAARDVVAARNAGLKEVVANDSVPGSSGSAPHFTVYTGPYLYASSARTELERALRNGYPHAQSLALPSTSGKGF